MVNKAKKARGRPSPKSTPKSVEKAQKPIVTKASNKEEVLEFDSLEMRIYHSGTTHEPQTLSDKVVYKYKPAVGETISLNIAKINELSQEEDNSEEVTYQDKDKTVSVRKSMIDSYRQKSNYFGPLRIIAEKTKVKDNGVLKEAIQAKLQHVEIQATDSQGKSVNDHELKILMSQTPGIIPSCDPPSNEMEKDEGYIVLNLGPGEKYKVLKKAMTAFKKLSGVEPPFNTKIQKLFTTIDGKATPVTLVTLYPRVNKVVYKTTQLNDKNLPLKKIIDKKDKGKQPKLVNYYRQNYINWSHRGNICFAEIKKIGIDFVEEILNDNSGIEDSLKELGCSSASTATSLGDAEDAFDDIVESTHPVGSKDFVEDVWQYLSNLVRNDNLLIEFEYEMDEEKWLEIKRAFNMFQISGEVLPDIVLKIACKNKDDGHNLTYYLRCVGRLIKTGPILSKVDVNYLLKCLTKDKYICVGLDKENFLQQADQNEMLRLHFKENCLLSTLPFESIYSKKCKAIVKEVDNVDNVKFARGQFTVFGPCVICQHCDALHKRLKELIDPSLNLSTPQEPSQRFVKQRYGPIQSINVVQSIKNLFTQTPQEFISSTKRKLCNVTSGKEEILSKQKKLFDSNLDVYEGEKLSIGVNEEEFETMIAIKKPSGPNGTSKKGCEKCGFQAKSMLSLFLHIKDHLGPLNEECEDCNVKLSSKEAVFNHKKICHSRTSARCSVCSAIFLSTEKLFEHMNCHRSSLPFTCVFCDQRQQTLNGYKKHLKITHQIATIKQMNFVCKICNSYFYTQDHLLIHRLNQNHIEKEHLKCKICNFSCIIASAFLTHILNHTYDQRESSNLATCLKCKKVFFSSYKLEDHMKKTHEIQVSHNQLVSTPIMVENEEDEGVQSYSGFTCGKCFKVYGTIDALQKHMEISHAEKVIVESAPVVINSIACTICGRKFNSEHFLNSHMKLHTANKPVFQCEECGFVYGKRTQVLEHIRSDHAEQVEKHQQMQQHHQHQQHQTHHHQHEIISENTIYEPQPNAYPGGQVITMETQPQLVQAPSESGWNQLKIPTVEQPQEVSYNFQNFNPQFF